MHISLDMAIVPTARLTDGQLRRLESTQTKQNVRTAPQCRTFLQRVAKLWSIKKILKEKCLLVGAC